MSKKMLYLLFFIFCLSFCSRQKKENWDGNYVFFEQQNYNNIREDSPHEWQYSMNLKKKTDQIYDCNLKLTGYELDSRLICEGKLDGNDLQVFFKKYDTNNFNSIQNLKKNDLLFTVSPADSLLFTEWEKLQPQLKENIEESFLQVDY